MCELLYPQVENKDNLPLSFDLLHLVQLKEGDRRPFLENSLHACTSDAVPAFMDKYLERIKGLEARVPGAICATDQPSYGGRNVVR